MKMARVYLDFAATSWPKPESVYAACDHFAREVGVAAGRGQHGASHEADRVLAQARKGIASLIGARTPQSIAITPGCTYSLNWALHGLLRPGDHVVTTVTEHNSVLRPLYAACQRGIDVTYVDCDSLGFVDPNSVLAATTSQTRLVVVNHASNVTGALQPIEAIGRKLKSRGIPFLVDAAQTLGTVPIDVDSMGISLLAAPGHKGLLGPLGTGLLYAAPEYQAVLNPIVQGGTGTQSELESQPKAWPTCLESGSLNTPAIAGLAAGIESVASLTVAAIHEQTRSAMDEFHAAIDSVPGVTRLGPRDATAKVGVVSISCSWLDPQELAILLDSHFGIQTRAGLHCAPRMHARLGTLPGGGTLRASIGATSQPHDLLALRSALETLAIQFIS